jgi:hypothetical protein
MLLAVAYLLSLFYYVVTWSSFHLYKYIDVGKAIDVGGCLSIIRFTIIVAVCIHLNLGFKCY